MSGWLVRHDLDILGFLPDSSACAKADLLAGAQVGAGRFGSDEEEEEAGADETNSLVLLPVWLDSTVERAGLSSKAFGSTCLADLAALVGVCRIGRIVGKLPFRPSAHRADDLTAAVKSALADGTNPGVLGGLAEHHVPARDYPMAVRALPFAFHCIHLPSQGAGFSFFTLGKRVLKNKEDSNEIAASAQS